MNKSTATLKALLALEGMRYADLAKKTGLAVGTVENIACGSSPSLRGRKKIESALGVTLWPQTDPASLTPHAPGAEAYRQ